MPPDPSIPKPFNPDARQADRIADLERQVRDMAKFFQGGAVQQIPVVASLPAAGRQGRVLMLASTSAIYKDTGSAWSPL